MTRKYKVIYDEKHQYYRPVPDIFIPPEIKEDILIDDLCWDYEILYCGVYYSVIPEYIGLYHLYGEEASNHKFPEYINKIKEIYEKPLHIRRLAIGIIEELNEYTYHELKEALPELFYKPWKK